MININKIRTLNDLKYINFYYHKVLNEPYAIINGCFDIIHPNHIRYIKDAYDICNNIVLFLNDDEAIRKLKGPDRPYFNINDRLFLISSIEYVSFVIPFGDRLYDVFEKCSPTYWIKGPDYDLDKLDQKERRMAEEKGINIRFTPRQEQNNMSTTKIVETISKDL